MTAKTHCPASLIAHSLAGGVFFYDFILSRVRKTKKQYIELPLGSVFLLFNDRRPVHVSPPLKGGRFPRGRCTRTRCVYGRLLPAETAARSRRRPRKQEKTVENIVFRPIIKTKGHLTRRAKGDRFAPIPKS